MCFGIRGVSLKGQLCIRTVSNEKKRKEKRRKATEKRYDDRYSVCMVLIEGKERKATWRQRKLLQIQSTI